MEQKKKAQKKIKTDLCRTLKQGTLLYMDGRLATPSQISAAMIKEPNGYMADYVADDDGNIYEIRYDKISK
ncbi:MAG: hypothetical protein IJZ44_00890 [Lachnospiraceae bacterium]|nr:hypothetical protein [Lachnospiraceae bacterium]